MVKNKSLTSYDLLQLPGIRALHRLWFFARLRGEHGELARTFLFLDLAEATRMNVPLDQSLTLIAEDNVQPELFSKPDDVTARLASYLLPAVRQGLSLSQAMLKVPEIFNRQDILLVQLGENTGMLSKTLKRLSEYRRFSLRLDQLKPYLMYPIWAAIIGGVIIGFVLTVIIPKFQAIFEELGVEELPYMTQKLVQASHWLIYNTPSFLSLLVLLFIASRLIRVRARKNAILPYPLYFPLFGRLYQSIRETRWLAALTLGLEAGTPTDLALQQAGTLIGGNVEKNSRKAAELVAKGCSIGQACIQCRVLRSRTNHRLQLIDWSGNYVDGLRAIAEDLDCRACESLERIGRRIEPIAVILVGVIVAFTVIAVYLPLFNIPKIVLSVE